MRGRLANMKEKWESMKVRLENMKEK